jgi:hypothetical protein
LPPFAKFAHLVAAVERATAPLASAAKQAASARLRARRQHQQQVSQRAGAQADAAAAQQRSFAALWRDGREEWEKHLGPAACFKLGLPPPPAPAAPAARGGATPSGGGRTAASAAANTTPSAADDDDDEEEEERNAVLTSSVVGARAACYAKVAASLFAGLERAATANDKYQDVCRLENYAFFADAVGAATDAPARQQKRQAFPEGGNDDDKSGGGPSRLELWHELDTAVADARGQYKASLAR